MSICTRVHLLQLDSAACLVADTLLHSSLALGLGVSPHFPLDRALYAKFLHLWEVCWKNYVLEDRGEDLGLPDFWAIPQVFRLKRLRLKTRFAATGASWGHTCSASAVALVCLPIRLPAPSVRTRLSKV